jgi:glycosyltransferase involved in cell wall biosynthesis
MNDLRILLVAPLPPPNGGISRWTGLLVDWLRRQDGIAFRLVDSAPRWRTIHDQRKWLRLLRGGLQGLGEAGRVLRHLLAFRPQVVHLTSSGSMALLRDLAVTLLARIFGGRVVYHIHMGRLPDMAARRSREWHLFRLVAKMASRVVVLDRSSLEALRISLPEGRVAQVPNGITLQARRPAPAADGTTALYLGWLVPTKGCVELIRAWRALRPPGWRLRLVGPGSPAFKDELRSLAGDDPGIEFAGEVSFAEAEKEMAQADLFVLPSHTEGFPYVVLEAMAAAKPIIATSVGAIAEMLAASSTEPCGLVVPARNAEALAEALRVATADAGLRHDLGNRARQRIETHYGSEPVLACLAQVWRGVLEKEPRPARSDSLGAQP